MADASEQERPPEYGDTWVYEGIIGALPGIEMDRRWALAIQFGFFESAIVVLAWWYDLWPAAIAGTVAVLVATVGSAELLRIGGHVRGEGVPDAYRRMLFGSNVEVVLTVLAYVALVTHLFVFDPRYGGTPILDSLFGPDPPVLVVYLTLLVLWDLCYRIGAGWWASVTALWRTVRYEFDGETRRRLRRADVETIGFGLVQLALVPLLIDQPVLLFVVCTHVVAVVVVTGLSLTVLHTRYD